jgi:hypothetical protein
MVELKKKITLKEKHESPSAPQPPSPSSNWWKWLVVAFAILALIGGIYWYSSKSGITESVPANVTVDSTKTDTTKVSQTDTMKAQPASGSEQTAQNGGTNAASNNSESATTQVSNGTSNANTESSSVEKVDTNAETDVENVEVKAKQVIRGDFGNGYVRKQKLGSEYTSIQNKVNEMYRTGAVR